MKFQHLTQITFWDGSSWNEESSLKKQIEKNYKHLLKNHLIAAATYLQIWTIYTFLQKTTQRLCISRNCFI